MNRSTKFMKPYLECLTLAVLAGSLPALSAAELSGKVKLKGTPPPEKKIVEAEATCGKFLSHPLSTRFYVTSSDAGLANVFVYIKEGAQKAPATGEAPLLDQTSCE